MGYKNAYNINGFIHFISLPLSQSLPHSIHTMYRPLHLSLYLFGVLPAEFRWLLIFVLQNIAAIPVVR
jgi:hypothetical protein